MDLNTALKRVRQLIAKAEAPNHETDPARREAVETEQQAARDMADKIMLDFAIEEAEARASRPAGEHSKPGTIVISLTMETDLLGHVIGLANAVARHCRCMIRHYTSWSDGGWNSTVYGWRSDLHYFEILYTTLRLHMIGTLRPRIERDKSLELNSYNLHNSGLNWAGIGEMYGWYKVDGHLPGERLQDQIYRNDNTGQRLSYWDMAGMFKKACYKEARRRGEKPLKIPTGGTESFRVSAAQGYSFQIRRRLESLEGNHGGAELLLRSSMDDVSRFFREENADLFEEPKVTVPAAPTKAVRMRKVKMVPFNEAAYARGVAHANTAALNPQAGAPTTRGISDASH